LINISDWVPIATLALGLLGIILVFAFKIGGIKSTIDNIEKNILEIKDDLKELKPRFAVVESRVNDLWTTKITKQRSPKYLNELGGKILKESNVNLLIDENYAEIFKEVKKMNPGNSYQAEQDIIAVVQRLILVPICQNKLEISAFQTGQSVNTIFYVGAIYIRDKIIKEIGLDVLDIDKHDPGKMAKKD
jgi:transcriptional regulator CtsR